VVEAADFTQTGEGLGLASPAPAERQMVRLALMSHVVTLVAFDGGKTSQAAQG
jgi:hypothetical protein